MTFTRFSTRLALCGALLTALAAQAQVQITDAWARATVAQQKATGVFMQLTAAKDQRLVAVQSPAAGISEVHEMKMEGDVMKMRPLPALALPAGQRVTLQPGGLHLMLMDLKQPLAAGSSLALTLTFEGADGVRQEQQLTVPVRAPGAAPAAGHGAHGAHGAHGR